MRLHAMYGETNEHLSQLLNLLAQASPETKVLYQVDVEHASYS
jgi:hypothetical protein